MIVKMKHLDLVCVASGKNAALNKLRALGVVHLDLARAQGGEVEKLKGEIADAEQAVRIIGKARKSQGDEVSCTQGDEASSFVDQTLSNEARGFVSLVLSLAAKIEELKAEADRLNREIKIYEPFEDFDPELAKKLIDRGIDLSDKLPAKLPEMRLSKMREKLSETERSIAERTARIAAVNDQAILAEYPTLRERIEFEQAKELVESQGAVAVLFGWVPQTAADALVGAARENGWGVLIREPAADEIPPTLVEPPKMFRPMKSLFEGLGIAPAYTEADVSVPFMCYFSLFFAMLVGDGAYGAIFLLGTLLLRKKLPCSWLVLLTVFSSATVLWGILSNTWFGAGIPCCADWLTAKWLADPSYNNMMLLCFTIGVSHLMLARVWNGICRAPDSTALAEFGWAGILLFMYLVINSIVGIFAGVPGWGFWLFGVSVVLVFAFTVKPSELKTRGAELGMLPLNIMSALGDIISYVRLFAVGLASVKVAENFNSMALGLGDGAESWAVKALAALATLAVLLVGHGLNLAMAGLSILVHAVRLNTLEFSNHKGVTWAGYAFRPFKNLNQKGVNNE